jgi:hypothetical protein
MNNKEEAVSLIRYCAEAVGNTHTFGHLTSSIYDTAWVAVLRKPGVPGVYILLALASHGEIPHFQCLKTRTFKVRISHNGYSIHL